MARTGAAFGLHMAGEMGGTMQHFSLVDAVRDDLLGIVTGVLLLIGLVCACEPIRRWRKRVKKRVKKRAQERRRTSAPPPRTDMVSPFPSETPNSRDLFPRDDHADDNQQLVPVRICPDCGEEEMVREREPGYWTNGPYLWVCDACGSRKSGEEGFDAELYPP